jgi:hypothetical protein
MNLNNLKTNITKNLYNFMNENTQERIPFSDLSGEHILSIFQVSDEYIAIITARGYVYFLIHEQDCCEHVYIEDVCGELENTTGLVVRAEENSSDSVFDEDTDMSETWTYYKLDTVNDNVTIRFCGNSNGYYSESVSTIRVLIPINT